MRPSEKQFVSTLHQVIAIVLASALHSFCFAFAADLVTGDALTVWCVFASIFSGAVAVLTFIGFMAWLMDEQEKSQRKPSRPKNSLTPPAPLD